MELGTEDIPASRRIYGTGQFELAEDTRLKIIRTDAEDPLVNEKVPNGKKWAVSIVLTITETDAA
jgi:hypothetical protein